MGGHGTARLLLNVSKLDLAGRAVSAQPLSSVMQAQKPPQTRTIDKWMWLFTQTTIFTEI